MIKLIEHKLFTVHKSYHDSFKSLNNDELVALRDHESLLQKVHEELCPPITTEDVRVFGQNLQVFRDCGENFKDLYTSVSIKEDNNYQSYFGSLILKSKPITGEQFNPVYTKIVEGSGLDSWSQVSRCLYLGGDYLTCESVKGLTFGFTLQDLQSYDRCLEAVSCIAKYLRDILTYSDFHVILNLCKTNEKFVFILLYPYFIKPLGNVMWANLLPLFHFVSGSFSTFLTGVFKALGNRSFITHLCIKNSGTMALGLGTVGILTLFSKSYAIKTNNVLISNGKLFQGLGGALGFGMSRFRIEGSIVIYEVAKTFSTFTSAAIAGAIEPKQHVFSSLIKSPVMTALLKNFKQ